MRFLTFIILIALIGSVPPARSEVMTPMPSPSNAVVTPSVAIGPVTFTPPPQRPVIPPLRPGEQRDTIGLEIESKNKPATSYNYFLTEQNLQDPMGTEDVIASFGSIKEVLGDSLFGFRTVARLPSPSLVGGVRIEMPVPFDVTGIEMQGIGSGDCSPGAAVEGTGFLQPEIKMFTFRCRFQTIPTTFAPERKLIVRVKLRRGLLVSYVMKNGANIRRDQTPNPYTESWIYNEPDSEVSRTRVSGNGKWLSPINNDGADEWIPAEVLRNAHFLIKSQVTQPPVEFKDGKRYRAVIGSIRGVGLNVVSEIRNHDSTKVVLEAESPPIDDSSPKILFIYIDWVQVP